MRKVIWTAAVLALCAAPAAAQQIEKSPFTPAPAATQQAAEPKKEPASEDATPSLRVKMFVTVIRLRSLRKSLARAASESAMCAMADPVSTTSPRSLRE